MEKHVFAAVDKSITIAYFWLNEGASQLSYSIYSLLNSIEKSYMNREAQERIEDLGNDIRIMQDNFTFSENPVSKEDNSKARDISNIPKIPELFSETEELKILWISVQAILNLFNYGAYELAFIVLMELGEQWHIVYELTVSMIKENEMLLNQLKEHFKMYMFFSLDVFGDSFFDEILKYQKE